MAGEDSAVLELWGACYNGNIERVLQLIEDDVDFCQRDRNGETVLHMAARSDNPEILNILLDHLSPDVHNNNQQTPLHLAAIKGHMDVIHVLLQADCQLEPKTKYSEMTALHLACQHNRATVVSALLDGGAICNVPDTIGKPPEFYATDPDIHLLFRKHAKHCTHFDPTHRDNPTHHHGTTHHDNPTHHYGTTHHDNPTHHHGTTHHDNPTHHYGTTHHDNPTHHYGTTHHDNPTHHYDPTHRDNPTHRKPTLHHPPPPTDQSLRSSDDNDDDNVSDSEEGRQRRRRQQNAAAQRRAKYHWAKISHAPKKIKINHGLGFSDEYKRRMEVNVFDRLMGNKKK